MNYELRGNYTKDAGEALREILIDRGVEDIDSFLRPTRGCELNPYDLENIEDAAQMLLKHLRNDSRICFIVD